VQGCDGRVIVGTGNELVREKIAAAVGLDLLELEVGPGIGEVGGGLFDGCLVGGGTSLEVTMVLKSTFSLLIRPETWLPTVTLTTGFKVPVALTTWVRSPRSTGSDK